MEVKLTEPALTSKNSLASHISISSEPFQRTDISIQPLGPAPSRLASMICQLDTNTQFFNADGSRITANVNAYGDSTEIMFFNTLIDAYRLCHYMMQVVNIHAKARRGSSIIILFGSNRRRHYFLVHAVLL